MNIIIAIPIFNLINASVTHESLTFIYVTTNDMQRYK